MASREKSGRKSGRPALYRQTKAFALRSLRREFHNRSTLFWTIGSPVLFYLLFGIVLGGGDSSAERAATALTFGIFGAMSATVSGFSSFLLWDLESRRYRKLRSLPVSIAADFAGRFVAGFVLGASSFTLIVALGVLTGASFSPRSVLSIPIAVVAVLLFCVIGMATGIVLIAIVKDIQRLNAATSGVMLVAFFVTGYNGVVPELLPSGLRPLVNVVPNALATRLLVGELVAADAIDGFLTPPPVPEGPLYGGLLVAETVLGSGLAVVLARKIVYDWELGETV